MKQPSRTHVASKRRRRALQPAPPKLKHKGRRRPHRDFYGRPVKGRRRVPLSAVVAGIFAIGLAAGVGIGLITAPKTPERAAVVAEAAPPPKTAPASKSAEAAKAEPVTTEPEPGVEVADIAPAPPEQKKTVKPKTAKKPAPPVSETSDGADDQIEAATDYAGMDDVAPVPPPPAAKRAPPEKPRAPKRVEYSYAPPAVQQAAIPAVPLRPWRGPGQPPWQRNAVAVEPAFGRPRIAIVIDDMGIDRVHTRQMIDLPGPLTTAFLTYADDLDHQTFEAKAAGHELMVHMAMEPKNPDVDPGPDVLRVGWREDRIRRQVGALLSRFTGHVGVNNHMGSRFTADARAMAVVLDEINSRGLLFLDSRTSGRTKGPAIAERNGMPFADRHVFLDNEPDPAYVLNQLRTLERWARQHGYAVGIGHPREWTVQALRVWLPTLQARGFQLVPISTIVAQRQHINLAAKE